MYRIFLIRMLKNTAKKKQQTKVFQTIECVLKDIWNIILTAHRYFLINLHPLH